MHLEEGNCYHIYNRGNNKQPIFFSPENYLFFLKKLNKHIFPVSDILAWCLMPNHFHLLVYANPESVKEFCSNKIPRQQFSEGIRMLLSSYAKAINKQNNHVGNLFQQKTKAKYIDCDQSNHLSEVFRYIHQNPQSACLVANAESWIYSSLRDYAGLRNGKLCNKELAAGLGLTC